MKQKIIDFNVVHRWTQTPYSGAKVNTDRLMVMNRIFNRNKIYGSLAGLGIFFLLTPNSLLAQMEVEMPVSAEEQTSQFQKIEQPVSLKLAVTLGGLSLIGAELWWFVFSGRSFKKTSKR